MSYRATKDDYKSVWSWVWFVAVFVVLLFLLGFGIRWITVPAETLASPERIITLSRQANEMYQSLEAQKATVRVLSDKAATIQGLYGDGAWPQGKRDEYQQIKTQEANAITAYNSACAMYRSLWSNEWSSIPAPDDLPTTCEML